MQRLRAAGPSIIGHLALPRLKRKALNACAAVQDTFYSTKDTFERHRVVFTVGTSLASIATAWGVHPELLENSMFYEARILARELWSNFCLKSPDVDAGYTLRHLHESKVEERLDSIEKAMKNNYQFEHSELKNLVDPGSKGTATCMATAGTTLIIGYGLGWRGGKWYASRKFRKEQMKLLGQIKPKKWPLKFLRRPLIKPRSSECAVKTSEAPKRDVSVAHNSGEGLQSLLAEKKY